MIWVAMTIPEDAGQLPAWLDAQLVGPNLGRLVAELTVVHVASNPPRRLDQILGARADDVLERGLSALPRLAIRELLRNPQLLLELQERVLIDGGSYWSELPVEEELAEAVDRGWQRLAPLAGRKSEPAKPATGLFRRLVPYAITSLATAAAIIVGIYFGFSRPQPASRQAEVAAAGWGWQKPDAFAKDLPREAYLNRLADEAEEWFNKRPQTQAELATRITEFRQGCTALILADHAPLTSDDRKLMKERCQKWAGKLDEQLAALEEKGDVTATLAATDATVKQLAKALRERAAT